MMHIEVQCECVWMCEPDLFCKALWVVDQTRKQLYKYSGFTVNNPNVDALVSIQGGQIVCVVNKLLCVYDPIQTCYEQVDSAT